MAIDALLNGARALFGVKVAVAAELVFQLTGANMSSPQTAELNADARAPTIGKWVNLTLAETIAWLVFLALLDQSWAWLIGGGIALLSMWAKYRYAINSGLGDGKKPTERYA